MELLLKKLPNDIINDIITYTYSTAPTNLLQDIKHYVMTAKNSTYQRVLLEIQYQEDMYNKIWKRSYLFNNNTSIYDNPRFKSVLNKLYHKRVLNLQWGLMNIEEREKLINKSNINNMPIINDAFMIQIDDDYEFSSGFQFESGNNLFEGPSLEYEYE
jgi:hypothetical protein